VNTGKRLALSILIVASYCACSTEKGSPPATSGGTVGFPPPPVVETLPPPVVETLLTPDSATLEAARLRRYAAPNGSPSNDGTIGHPWDLPTALSKPGPGFTVWLRGGTYRGTFTSSLTGTQAKPITVRQYPHERAILDVAGPGDVLTVGGAWTTYWGFELTNSDTARSGIAGTGGQALRGDGVYVQGGSHLKFINLVVHDVGHGTFLEGGAHDVEIYGWLIYNGGYQDTTRSDGHAIYVHADGVGWKVIRDNVAFNQFGYGIHGYAETSSALKQIVLDGNILFNNGTLSSYDNNQNLQLGGNGPADQDSITNNLMYFPDLGAASMWMNVRIGYGALVNGSAYVANNLIFGGREAVDVGCWQSLTTRTNALHTDPGFATYAIVQRCGGTDSIWTGTQRLDASWQQVIVRPNRYEPGRGLVAILNGTKATSVAVDLVSVLQPGAHYEVRNVQDVFGKPVLTGTYYAGDAIPFPMKGVAPPAPIGGSPHPPLRTAPLFDVFLVTTVP
jgi:hypothetical protein